RLRRYEIQLEADRFGILPQLSISPSLARPCGPFQSEFHRFRRRFGVILMVRLPLQALQETA
ncbi:MAG: hypothetical protein ACI9W6_001913, partial [Motiliproteus sp.]